MTHRKVFLMRIKSTLVPAPGVAAQLDLPDLITEQLDTEGWSVVNHHLALPDLTGDMVLSLYCERETD